VTSKDRPAPPKALATTTAERLAAIVEAAERAATTVIDDAEKEARRQLERAEAEADSIVSKRLASLANLTDSLVVQVEAIKSQSEGLLFSLEEAKRRIDAELDGEGPAAESTERLGRGSHLSAVAVVEEPVAEDLPRPEGSNNAEELGSSAGARLLATQMAVSGSSREEIQNRLRNGFEIEDTASILDAILGPEN
jgi:hypothetical protein